jgi:alkylation response protein AidB-like acyl-CoA dehydrogenase
VDFSRSETQEELVGLARRILADHSSMPQLRASEASNDGIDRACWDAFAGANLLGIAIPESQGGLGLGFLDLCLVLREVGRSVVPLPVVPCLVTAALAGARYGSAEQQEYLAEVAAGRLIATAALHEYGTTADEPYVTAVPDGDTWWINGVKTMVPYADIADGMVISTRVEGTDDVAMFFVGPQGDGRTLARQQGQNAEHLFEITFDNVSVGRREMLGSVETGREVLRYALDHTIVATAAVVGGVCDAAMRLTAQYTVDRKQFDRAIGTFQAVSQRMADAYINNQAIELTMLQAATHLDEGRDVPEEVATARYWACEGGNQIGHTALHVHGGISIDLDYPIHRHFLWIKQAEFMLGAATPTLERLGALIAAG